MANELVFQLFYGAIDLKYLSILMLAFCCSIALAMDETSPPLNRLSSANFLTSMQASAQDLLTGPGAWPEQLDLALTDALVTIGRHKCPECERAIEKIEFIKLAFGQDGPLIVSERIALEIFERFQVMLLFLPKPTQVHTAPEGRFYQNYLINLFKFAMRDHALDDHRELVEKVFSGDSAPLKCGLVINLKLEDKDISWLLHQAALPENSAIRSCLAGKLLPRISPRAQMALAARLWHIASPLEQKKLQVNFSRVMENSSQIEKHEPILRWMVEQNHPDLLAIVQSMLKKDGIEKLPNLLQRLFDLAGNNNLDLIETLGGRLCEAQLQPILFNLIEHGTFWQRILLVGQVISKPGCYDDPKILEGFIKHSENYSLLAAAQQLLPKVKNQREVSSLILEKIDWSSDEAEEIVTSTFILDSSLAWQDLFEQQIARLDALDPVRAKLLLERVLQFKPWWRRSDLLLTDGPCQELLTNRPTSN